jgi:hypothetical protein
LKPIDDCETPSGRIGERLSLDGAPSRLPVVPAGGSTTGVSQPKPNIAPHLKQLEIVGTHFSRTKPVLCRSSWTRVLNEIFEKLAEAFNKHQMIADPADGRFFVCGDQITDYPAGGFTDELAAQGLANDFNKWAGGSARIDIQTVDGRVSFQLAQGGNSFEMLILQWPPPVLP